MYIYRPFMQVDEFTFPIYNPTDDNDAVIPYTSSISMKYPKPGYPNPLVTAHIFDYAKFTSERALVGDAISSEYTFSLNWEERQPANDSVITQITWIGNSSLILKESSRNATTGSVVFFDLSDVEEGVEEVWGTVVRKLGKEGEQGDDGWIEASQDVLPLPQSLAPEGGAYLDIVPNDGWDHIALYSPANASKPRFLTEGEWEVTAIGAVDAGSGIVYVCQNLL